MLACLAIAPGALAASRTPHIHSVRCIRVCASSASVEPGGLLRVTGLRFSRGLRVVFQIAPLGHRRSFSTRVLSRSRLSVPVPANAVSGVLYVRDRAGRRSNRRPISVVSAPQSAATPSGTAFDGNGMWIWYVAKSSGGDPNAIVAQAQQHGISTVYVKSSDGTSFWSQFSAQLVSTLKAAGLHVCAWQYVYGDQPQAEAQLGAQAVSLGADCLVIDAESQYEGRYAQAQQYVTALRQAIGPSYPVGLTSFPYVDYHPALPYSVFLGPGAAQFDLPQVYWKEIGGGVDAVVDHTYRFNRIYGRAIDPIGQLYDAPADADIVRFRQLAAANASAGVSWWDWQDAQPDGWTAISQPLGALAPPAPAQDFATYGPGGKGDSVVWAQEHLNGAGQAVPVTGSYDAATQQAVANFQAANGLPPTGSIDTTTWQALLKVTPVMVDWTAPAPSGSGGATAARSRTRAPSSARLPAVRDEIPAVGRG